MKQSGLATEIDMFGRMTIALEEIEACREFVSLITEVRTNMVFAHLHAKTPGEVIAAEGTGYVSCCGYKKESRCCGREHRG